MIKKYLFLFTLITCFSLNAAEDNNSEYSRKFEEVQLASKWILMLNSGIEAPELVAKLSSYKNRLIPLGKTYLSRTGTKNRKVFNIYVVGRTNDHLVYLTSEDRKIKIVIGAPVSNQTYTLAVRNSANLLLYPPNPEPIFQNLLKILIASSQHSKSQYNKEPLVYGEDGFNREVAKIGKYVTISFNLNDDLTPNQLADFLLILWMSVEKDKDIKILMPSEKENCSKYLLKTL